MSVRRRCPCSRCRGHKVLSESSVYAHLLRDRNGIATDADDDLALASAEDSDQDDSGECPNSSNVVGAVDDVEDSHAQPAATSAAARFSTCPAATTERSFLDEPAWTGDCALSLRQLLHSLVALNAEASLSQATMTKFLKILHAAAPTSDIPSNFRQLQQLLAEETLQLQTSDVCVNDCCAFVGDRSQSRSCDKCEEERFDERGKPRKRFTHVDIGAWLRQLYGVPLMAELLQNHSTTVRDFDERAFDIHHMNVWATAFAGDGLLAGDKRHVALSFSFDGTGVFDKKQHCIWPCFVQLLNLPGYLRNKAAFTLTWGIIPGPTQPKSLDAYCEILVSQLNVLSLGIPNVVDSSKAAGNPDRTFLLKAMLLLIKADYEGQKLLLHGIGATSAFGCLRCDIEGFRSKTLSKFIFGQHRRYFPPEAANTRSDLRMARGCIFMSNSGGPFVGRENRETPKLREHADVVAHMREAQETGKPVKGFKAYSAICELPYFDSLIMMSNDIMHALDSLFKRLCCVFRQESVNDGPKARQLERELQRHKESWITGNIQPIAPWNLTPDQRSVADKRRANVYFPCSVEFNKSLAIFECFDHDLNTSDTIQMLKYKVLNYCVKGFLGDDQRRALKKFVKAMVFILRPSTLAEKVRSRSKLAKAMTALEAHFPYSLQVLHMHHVHHFLDGLIQFGSASVVANMDTDRFIKTLKSAIHVTHGVEVSLMKSSTFAMCGNLSKQSEYIPEQLRSVFSDNAGVKDFEIALESSRGREEPSAVYEDSTIQPTRSYASIAKQISLGDFNVVPKLYGRSTTKELSANGLQKLNIFYSNYFPELPALEAPAEDHEVQIFDRCFLIDPDEFKVARFYTERIEATLKTRNSYVMQTFVDKSCKLKRNRCADDPTKFYWVGRIEQFWRHTRGQKAFELAVIRWFDAPYYEKREDLWRVDLTAASSGKTFEPVDNLFGHGVVVAEESDELFVLQYC